MKSRKQGMGHNTRRDATLTTEWWRRFGILCLILAATAMVSQAQTYTYSVLYTFAGPPDGGDPYANLTLDASGNLYGTTYAGGSAPSGACSPAGIFWAAGCGVVFKLTPAGDESVLYSFSGGADGGCPSASVLQDRSGDLYGTTDCGGYGAGVVFKLSPTGKEMVLHAFTLGLDGGYPGSLVRGAAGQFYGPAGGGGSLANGLVFRINATGNEHVISDFTGGTDGGGPSSLLLNGKDLSGVTRGGGANGSGTVFKLTTAAGKETVLYSFCSQPNCTDGEGPRASLIQDAAGNLYGTAFGGAFGGGVVFKVDPSGQETVLYNFTGGADGSDPQPGLVMDASGNLYGTTFFGGNFTSSRCTFTGCGVVFEVSPSGTETVLYTFTGETDGGYPQNTGLISDSSGNLYGATFYGGSTDAACTGSFFSGCGVVFKLTPQ
jgi:uncharacterized repeat protein (TIGR03803 family)